MPSPSFLSYGHTPRRTDTKWYILQRILGALQDGAGGTGATLTGAFADPNGNVTPTNTSAASIYYQEGVGGVNNYWRWDTTDQTWYQIGGP